MFITYMLVYKRSTGRKKEKLAARTKECSFNLQATAMLLNCKFNIDKI